MKNKGLAMILVSVALAVPGVAQISAQDSAQNGAQDSEQDSAQNTDDGPGRGVARISVINGDVSMRRGDSGDVIAGAINAPLMVQDRVLTGAASRAEIQFDWANMLRLNSMSEVRLSELEDQRFQIQIASGTVIYRVLRDSSAQVELSTPNISVRPVKKGVYRITVREDGTTEVTVRSGEAEIFTPKGSETLKSGRTMLARGMVADPEFQNAAAIPMDDWDHWNERRDKDLERSHSYQYVSRDVYGADDLDDYGSWVHNDPYGWVWSPRVAVGWAPYRSGRWVWADWYGWSWVSYDPWGWAPYHYGRWFYGNTGWCWWPGGMGGRHYWSPGLVAFFGWGGGGRFGGIGWVPLGPHERYNRWYGNGYYGGYGRAGGMNNSRIVNNVNINNVYRNARVANGVTGVNAGDFGRGGGGHYARLSAGDMRGANLVKGQLPVAPTRASLRMSDRQVRAGSMPQSRSNTQFYSRTPSAAVQRVPFEQQRQSLEQSARGATAGVNRSAAPATAQSAPRTTAGASGQNGWRKAGDQAGRNGGASPAVQQNRASAAGTARTPQAAAPDARTSSPAPARQGSNDNWQRFGGDRRSTDSVNRTQSAPGNSRYNAPATQSSPRYNAPATQSSPRYNAPATQSSPRYNAPATQSSPRYNAPQSRSSQQSVRVSPPIVQQRSAPAPSARSSGGGGGSAPSRTQGSGGGGRSQSSGGGRSSGRSR